MNIREYRQKTLEYLKTDNKDVLQEISQLLEDAGLKAIKRGKV